MTKLLWDGSEFRRTETADLSTALRSGRDDKGQDCCGMDRSSGEQKPQISPLRCAPVEMEKGRTGGVMIGVQENRNRRSFHCAAAPVRIKRVGPLWDGSEFRGK